MDPTFIAFVLVIIVMMIAGASWAVGAGARHSLARALRDPAAANEIADATEDVTATSALTDSSGGSVVSAIAAGVGKYELLVPLSSLATGIVAGAMDIVTGLTISHRFKILAFDFVPTIAGTGAGATQAFNLEIGTTDVTGGVVTPTLANTATVGAVVAGTAVTANNVGAAGAAISIEKAAGTVFTAGAGFFRITIQNMDTADALATLVQG